MFEATKGWGGFFMQQNVTEIVSLLLLASSFHPFLHVCMTQFYLSLKARLSYKRLCISQVGIHLLFPQLSFPQLLWFLPFSLPWVYLCTSPR